MAGEGASWLFATLLALSLRDWSIDVGFLRATYEAWGLSVLVLVYTRAWQARYLLAGAGATTIAIALMYIVRV